MTDPTGLTCPVCYADDRVYEAEAALEFLEEQGQLDDWTAAWLGDEAALERLLAREDVAQAIEPRDYYCDCCFSTFNAEEVRRA